MAEGTLKRGTINNGTVLFYKTFLNMSKYEDINCILQLPSEDLKKFNSASLYFISNNFYNEIEKKGNISFEDVLKIVSKYSFIEVNKKPKDIKEFLLNDIFSKYSDKDILEKLNTNDYYVKFKNAVYKALKVS